MRLRLLLATCGSLLCIEGASAQTHQLLGTIREQTPTVLSVLQNAGCSELWLSQALSESNIRVADVQRLRPGTRIVLRRGLCARTPPANVAARSREILRVEESTDALTTMRTELSALRASTEQAAKTLGERISKTEEGIAAATQRLDRELAEARTDPAMESLAIGPAEIGMPRWRFIATGMLIFIAGALAAGLILFLRDRNTVKFRKRIVIKDGGRSYGFPLRLGAETAPGTGRYAAQYGCDNCPATVQLPGNKADLLLHIRQAHNPGTVTERFHSGVTNNNP